MKKLFAIAGGALGLYIVIVLGIAVIPAIELSQVPPGPGVEPLTALQNKGRAVFAANGCGYCHTQQVRPLAEDAVFGRPSAPGDFAYQTPELLGSERTGPDLTNVGKTKPSKVWQYMHLYEPRSVVAASVMPNFKFLFKEVDKVPAGESAVPVPAAFAPKDGKKVIPTADAKALVAYLLSLKQAPIPGYTKPAPAVAPSAPAPAAPAQGATAKAGTSTAASSGGYQFVMATGKSLFTTNCSACHQATGLGLPGVFPPLKGNPAVNNADPTLHMHTVLFGAQGVTIDGVAYASPMPNFDGSLSDTDIANIINYERSSWGNHAPHVTPADVAAVRAKGK